MQVKLLTSLVALAAPLASAASCSNAWTQCGGIGYSGPTCCVDGSGCKVLNDYYSQCVPGATPSTTAPAATTTTPAPTATTATPAPTSTTATPAPTTKTPAPTTATPSPTTATPAPTATTSAPTSGTYLTYDTTVTPAHDHDPWTTGTCDSMPTEACMSGTNWGEKTTVSANEDWHYSRSTHFGLTNAGACGFGMYGLCTKGSKTASWTDPSLGGQCDAFCKAYPVLCQDPANTTLRGNFAAPDGKYYTQFWPHLPGNKDNYLSCGECFEVVRTKTDGTDYQPGESGYTDPVVLEIIDSCPCNVNQKWCCGSGVDQCQDVNSWKYGCPIPKESTHLDLSDIAMGRLVGGGQQEGVIPTRYRRVSCPKPGNMYIWLRDNSGPYYLALSVVNSAGVGGIAKIDIKGAGSSTWTAMLHDPNYSDGHPQDRYGSWTIPKGSGPYNLPVSLRITSPNGEQAVVTEAIKSYTPPASAPSGYYYIDLGIQFSAYGKH